MRKRLYSPSTGSILKDWYWNRSYQTRLKYQILLGKIARFFINLQPQCTCGCQRGQEISKYTALGFEITGTSEISTMFKDGTSTIHRLPIPGSEWTLTFKNHEKTSETYRIK